MEIASPANELRIEELHDPKIKYVQQGSGDPVILIHGLAASFHDWDDLLPDLAAHGYAGYALDLLGHGESAKPADRAEYTVAGVYQHFTTWLDRLEITEPLTLVAHSLGGSLALLYALQNPARVAKLVLINPFYDIKQLSPVIQHPILRQFLNTGLIELTPYWLFRLFVDVTSLSFHTSSREAHSLPKHVRYQTALDYMRASSGIYNIVHTLPNLTSSLAQIQQPTLLLWGARDQTLNPASFPKLAQALPNVAGAHGFPLCGHVPHQCHPQDLNPYVLDFLRS
ncbi:MAG: alpha/beta hydrolase [Anaerolineales bacterium]|nr:alpha/beta hydrolase [Anaerolineales bacterium]